MTRTERRLRGALPLALIVLALAACSETVSATEPSNPTPPAPAPAASMSGTVRSYGPLLPGTTLECQGKKATASADGTYALEGLEAGPATVRVTYAYETAAGAVVTDSENFDVVLAPGPNVKDFVVL